jgi:hypothetical protein
MTKLGNIHFRHPLENKRSSTDYIYYGEKEGNVYKVNPEELYINTETSTSYAILNEGILNSSLDNFIKIEYGTSLDSLTTLSTSSYTINPETAVITFSSLPSGSNLHFWATYKGVGSIVWAEDVVSLQQATSVIDTETLYKDGSVVMTGNLNLGNYNINNVNNINVNGTVDGVDVSSHNHSGGQGGLIETNSIVNSAITTSKIADGAVNNDKIDSVNGSKINGNSITYDKLSITAINSITVAVLSSLYPIGSIYITTADTCPIATLGVGTWTKVSNGRVLQGADNDHAAGSTIEAGLPNITGSPILGESTGSWSKMPPINGAIYRASTGSKYAGAADADNDYLAFDASRSNSIYGNSSTVQPPAYVVNIFRRVQ